MAMEHFELSETSASRDDGSAANDVTRRSVMLALPLGSALAFAVAQHRPGTASRPAASPATLTAREQEQDSSPETGNRCGLRNSFPCAVRAGVPTAVPLCPVPGA